jgi:hypothetical protein
MSLFLFGGNQEPGIFMSKNMKNLIFTLALFSSIPLNYISADEGPPFLTFLEPDKLAEESHDLKRLPSRHPMWRPTPHDKEEQLEALSEETKDHLKKEIEEIAINLKDPTFSHGIISTDQGGIISANNLRIQAQKISYINKIENGVAIKKIIAEDDILLERNGSVFVGSHLEYDFISQTGSLRDGRTCTDFWFLGGDEIFLEADGSFVITNAFLTTVEGQDNWWELKSSKLGISNNNLLSAKNISFRFFKFPFLWLPSFKANLKFIKEAPIRFRFLWEQILKQKISMRYELYSTETFSLYGRLDYRFKYGPGAAIETDYHSLDERTVFQTKTYGAFDKIVPQESGDKRYRLQGLLTTHSKNEKTHFHIRYDKLSDDKMPQDFKSDDFELNTQKRTILWVSHQETNYFAKLNVQPRINNFQSINQELPLIKAGLRPFTLGSSGIVSDNQFSAGYLDYVFLKKVQKVLPSLKSGRFATQNSLYRPIHLGPFNITPEIGVIGIFYTNTPQHKAVGQGMFTYGGEMNTQASKNFPSLKHVLEPYVSYEGLTRPLANNNHHFIFNLEDGYATLNQVRFGLNQNFFSHRKPTFLPGFSWDLYTYTFFGKTAFHMTAPKGYTDFTLRRPFLTLKAGLAYNFQERLVDYTNGKADITVSENIAFGLEFRHRSKYDWRKADHHNFILDVVRPTQELASSPVSDGRNTFLTRVQLRLTPLWTCHFESHQGWGRRSEPNYQEFKLRLTTLLTGKWHLEFGLAYDPANKWAGIVPTFKLIR